MRGSGRPVTRDDVARLAGVSTAVVSYVVNDGPRPVAQATRSRVLAAIDQTGYRVNDVARALAGGRSRTFGFAAPNLANPFIAEIARRLAQVAEARGALLFVGDTTDDKARESRVLRSFVQRQVDGIVCMSVDEQLSSQLADGCGIPTVVLQHADPHPLLASVRIDEVAAARRATEHLVSHGHRRFGAVLGRAHLLNSQLRLDGFRAALDAAGIDSARCPVVFSEPTRAGGYTGAQELLDRDPGLEAVFAGNEAEAIGAISAAAQAGRRTPEDLAVVAFNGSEGSRFHLPPLTVVRQPLGAMVRRVVELLDAPVYSPTDHTFDADLVVRRSCGCPYAVDAGDTTGPHSPTRTEEGTP